jgi:hypothetical protein
MTPIIIRAQEIRASPFLEFRESSGHSLVKLVQMRQVAWQIGEHGDLGG